MAEYHDEMEQVEALKRWWGENRWYVIAGVVIGVSVVGGWRGWEWWTARQSEAGSSLYAHLSAAVVAKDVAGYDAQLATLVKDYARTPYAANGALLVAKAAVDAGDLTKAQTQLAWVVANARDAELKLLAGLRLARVQLAAGEHDVALKTLDGLGAAGAFEGQAQEVRGDVLRVLGRSDEARSAYQAALAAGGETLIDRDLVELKLADLGAAAAVPEATK
jgi:predicted negative regulator of RcsB-dependent stress response